MNCRMVCIGVGPGPKNVLVEFEDGSNTVVPYAVWKHRLSKQGDQLAEGKQYLVASGFIQKFPNKDAVSVRQANGQEVRDITIKAVGSQKLIRITVWPEFASVPLAEGDYVAVEGAYSASGDQGQFHNISAARIAVVASGKKAEREVVNQQAAPAATGGDTNPF